MTPSLPVEIHVHGTLFATDNDAPPVPGARTSGGVWHASLTLDDLAALIERHGKLVIRKPRRGDIAFIIDLSE
jgi:hypothetical protein